MIKENTFPDGNVGGERKAGGKDEEEAMMALEYPPVITYLHNRNRCRANKKISFECAQYIALHSILYFHGISVINRLEELIAMTGTFGKSSFQ